MRKVTHFFKLSRYALSWREQIQFHRIQRDKDKICLYPRMRKMRAIEFYYLGCDVILSFIKQDYWPTNSCLNYFDELYFNPLSRRGDRGGGGELYVEENTFLEDYVEVK